MNLLIALCRQGMCLTENAVSRTTALPAPCIRDNAERAELVASFDDRDVSDMRRAACGGIQLEKVCILCQADIDRPCEPLLKLPNQFRESANGLCSHHQSDL